MRPVLRLSQLVCWLCWLCCAAAAATSLLPHFIRASWGVKDRAETVGGVRRFLELRTGGGRRSCVWHWTGCIRNPLTGSEVVGVSGVETVRQLANSSYLSSRVLVYTEVGNSTAPLTSYRVRRQSPKRPVEPTRIVHELVTLGAEPRAATANLSSELRWRPFTQVSFPGGRSLRSKKIEFTDVSNGGVKIVHHINGVSARKRPVNKWVSFAPDGGSSSQHGKNQEYYHIAPTPGAGNPFYGLAPWRLPLLALTSIVKRAARAAGAAGAAGGIWGLEEEAHGASKGSALGQARAQATLQCSRFGECPPWFSVGRTCTTELTALRFSSLNQLPAATLQLVEQSAPRFLSSSKALLAAADDAAALLEWGKGRDALSAERFRPWWRRLHSRT